MGRVGQGDQEPVLGQAHNKILSADAMAQHARKLVRRLGKPGRAGLLRGADAQHDQAEWLKTSGGMVHQALHVNPPEFLIVEVGLRIQQAGQSTGFKSRLGQAATAAFGRQRHDPVPHLIIAGIV